MALTATTSPTPSATAVRLAPASARATPDLSRPAVGGCCGVEMHGRRSRQRSRRRPQPRIGRSPAESSYRSGFAHGSGLGSLGGVEVGHAWLHRRGGGHRGRVWARPSVHRPSLIGDDRGIATVLALHVGVDHGGEAATPPARAHPHRQQHPPRRSLRRPSHRSWRWVTAGSPARPAAAPASAAGRTPTSPACPATTTATASSTRRGEFDHEAAPMARTATAAGAARTANRARRIFMWATSATSAYDDIYRGENSLADFVIGCGVGK